jgi:hypothetical protein
VPSRVLLKTNKWVKHSVKTSDSWFSNSDFLAAQSGAGLSDTIGEVIMDSSFGLFFEVVSRSFPWSWYKLDLLLLD